MSNKSTSYGKRYTDKQKQAIVAAWQKNLTKAKPLSKSKFCVGKGITTITLDAWLGKKAKAKTPSRRRNVVQASPEVVVVAPVVVEDVTHSVEESIADLVQAIEQNQANIAELKGRLLQLVDAL